MLEAQRTILELLLEIALGPLGCEAFFRAVEWIGTAATIA